MPLHILTVLQRCTAGSWVSDEVALADHLSQVSLTNKVNFARLHGLSLQVVANTVSGCSLTFWLHRVCLCCNCL